MPVDYHQKVIFFHIPKTAGMSVKTLLVKQGFIWKLSNPNLRANTPGHWIKNRVIQEVGEAFYDQAYKFCFVRNPFDRLVSEYFWNSRIGHQQNSWSRFLEVVRDLVKEGKFEGDFDDHLRPQSHYPLENMDFIGRYETLQKDMDTLLKHFKRYAPSTKLNHDNISFARQQRPWQDMYSPEDTQFVKDLYAQDFKELNYA